uniref:Uncharacterized protein n=1 Tax=Aegilops tauschii subsp. strangulata TaxID=200361 RepID=A0A453HBP1_AEGTS
MPLTVPLALPLLSVYVNMQVSQLQLPGTKEMRHADRKLKHCLDPSSSSHDDHKKKEKKSKHKSKRTASDAQL